MMYADVEELDILGIDLLRCLRCRYSASCGNQCLKMISVEHLESKMGLKIAGVERVVIPCLLIPGIARIHLVQHIELLFSN